MYLVFTRKPVENYRRRLGSLLLYLCCVFRALINSLACWFSIVTWFCFRSSQDLRPALLTSHPQRQHGNAAARAPRWPQRPERCSGWTFQNPCGPSRRACRSSRPTCRPRDGGRSPRRTPAPRPEELPPSASSSWPQSAWPSSFRTWKPLPWLCFNFSCPARNDLSGSGCNASLAATGLWPLWHGTVQAEGSVVVVAFKG